MPPLAGIRVLDLSRVLAGPYCTQFLGDMGAEVVKVEPPLTGDETRGWGPPFVGGAQERESVYFMAANRSKRGITLDLKTEAGRAIARELAAEADILVENYRPGTMAKWGLDHAALSEANPRLIYIAISGFGQTGRHRDRPGYDLIAQGMGGLMGVTGAPGGEPVKAGFPVADLNGGTWGIIAALMGLQARERTGRGQYMDLSLLEAQMSWHVYGAGMYFHTGRSPQRRGSQHEMIAPYQAYATADGWITVAVPNDKFWASFCALLGNGLAEDPRFGTNALRVEHRDALNAVIEPLLAEQTSAYWLDALAERGIPSGNINTIAELYSDPWAEEREQIVRLPHPVAGTYVGTGFPFRASETPARPSAPPPTLGQHTAEVMGELGYDAAAIDALRAQGAFGREEE
ncbi:formyl-CoA transferase [Murinocardiopsis flavida]|uniref:Formyl-CoA transferase n=1 Tax=Murinocardiopsis flavida TaxID=645275 RepID=A0A2P8CXJ9_9ACTN|nr:CoA transferase [Murinocardiopsis flavida]PSK89657.1 formyl-CoA transferase [Murinocardiopsis flavida]